MTGSHRRSGGWTDGRNDRTRGAHLGDRRSHRVVPIPAAPARDRRRMGAAVGRVDASADVTRESWRTGNLTGPAVHSITAATPRARALYDAA